jgi:hypothetical protein
MTIGNSGETSPVSAGETDVSGCGDGGVEAGDSGGSGETSAEAVLSGSCGVRDVDPMAQPDASVRSATRTAAERRDRRSSGIKFMGKVSIQRRCVAIVMRDVCRFRAADRRSAMLCLKELMVEAVGTRTKTGRKCGRNDR